MSQVVVTSFMTLDGVVEAPEQWSFPYWNQTIERYKDDELGAADAQLLGRRTYEIFAEAWPERSGGYADRLNAMPKYVVSTSLQRPQWNNSQVIGSSHLDLELAELKQRHAGYLLVHGSGSLVRTLMQRDLVDEYRLLVYPLVLGEGKRLFANGVNANLELSDCSQMGSGVALLIYRRREKAP